MKQPPQHAPSLPYIASHDTAVIMCNEKMTIKLNVIKLKRTLNSFFPIAIFFTTPRIRVPVVFYQHHLAGAGKYARNIILQCGVL